MLVRYRGTVKAEDDEVIHINDLIGWAEEHRVHWRVTCHHLDIAKDRIWNAAAPTASGLSIHVSSCAGLF